MDLFGLSSATAPRFGLKRLAATVALGAALAIPSAAVLAGQNKNFIAAPLDGVHEVPIRGTQGHGTAKFQLSPDGTSLSYHLNVANIDNVTQSHIHIGAPDVIGPIAVWLYPVGGPPAAPNGSGRFDGVLAQGTITAANFIGPLAGQPFSALLTAIDSGNAYVNVHTNDGVAPTNTGPGDFPGGEIRNTLRHEGH